MTRPTIFEFAGGAPAFRALAAAHHELCLADPVLEHPFSHGVSPDHVRNLADYWGEVFGGPPAYSGRDGGHSAMLRIHAGQGADDELGSRFLSCFLAAVDDAGLPEDAEFRAALKSYMESAVAEVMSYAPRNSTVEDGLPIPQWTWDGPRR